MSQKDSPEEILDAIDDVTIPSDLSENSLEEIIYDETNEEIQHDHKNQETFNIYQHKAKEEISRLKNENTTLEIENDNLSKLANHRRYFSWAILVFVFIVVFITLYIVAQSGSPYVITFHTDENKSVQLLITHYILSDKVLMTLLGTNLVQVVGILLIVVNWLYPSNNNHNSKTPVKKPTNRSIKKS